MNEQKIVMGALAMDLKRVALSLYRGSYKSASIFKSEALKRSSELEKLEIENYVKKLISEMKNSLADNNERTAEDALMYSTLFQNFAFRKM